MKKLLVLTAVAIVAGIMALGGRQALALPKDCGENATTVPGHCSPNIPDTDVTGHYNAFYQEDADGDWYWDLGDGRVYSSGTVDTEPVVSCYYQVQYRGNFGGDPFLDSGWIINNIRCDDGSAFNYLIVHETDPRYTGDPDWAVWGTWEWHVLTESGSGNLVARPWPPGP